MQRSSCPVFVYLLNHRLVLRSLNLPLPIVCLVFCMQYETFDEKRLFLPHPQHGFIVTIPEVFTAGRVLGYVLQLYPLRRRRFLFSPLISLRSI